MPLAPWLSLLTMICFHPMQEGGSAKSATTGTASDSEVRRYGASDPAAACGFLYKTLEFKGQTYAYCVYVPPEYSAREKWPMILFLHGSGERGSDGLLQTEVGIGTAIRRKRGVCPAIVVMPQCRPGHWWTNEMAEMALKCVEQTSREYNLDPERLYLTGLSMGGAGAWLLASQFPERFAAVVPICGFVGTRPDQPADTGQLKEMASKLAKTPIWSWHGGADKNVPPERSREVIAALRAAGGSPKYNEVAQAEHNVWDAAYGDGELWKWMLGQRREGGATAAPREER